MAEMDYGQIKDKLIVELVGADRNAEMLKAVPHTMVEDMAAIYKIRLESDENHQATAGYIRESSCKYRGWQKRTICGAFGRAGRQSGCFSGLSYSWKRNEDSWIAKQSAFFN